MAVKDIEVYQDPDLVILKNPIATARFGLTVLQTKVLFEAVAYFKANQEKRTMKLFMKQFLQNIGMENSNNYQYVADEIEEMTKINLRIERKSNRKAIDFLAVNLFASADFKINEFGYGFVEIEVSDKLKPYFLEIANGEFFYYHILNTRVLKSRYSIKLYLFLKSWKRKEFIDVHLHDLRELVEVEPHEYSEYRYFKKRVLETAKNELLEKCDLAFNYEEIRIKPNNQKSEVIKIRFFILENKTNWKAYKKQREDKHQTIEIKDKPQKIDKLLESQIKKIESIPVAIIQEIPKEEIPQKTTPEVFTMFRVFEPQATDLEITEFLDSLPKLDNDRLLDVLLFAKQEKKKGVSIKSIYAYIVYGLKNNVGKGLLAKEKGKLEKEQQRKKSEQENKQVQQWYEYDFLPIYNQYLYDLGTSADLQTKNSFLESKKQEANANQWIRKHYFDEDGTPKSEPMRIALGVEISKSRAESKDSLFAQWIIENKGIRVEKVNDTWKKCEEPIF